MKAASRRQVGPERVLLSVYLVFVVAAGSRSVVQLATHPAQAPLAYALSLAAALVYATGFALVRRIDTCGGTTALRLCSTIELAGVLAIGTWSIADPAAFPDDTVWSDYGAGYLGVPLLLPIVVLIWLSRQRRELRLVAEGCREGHRGPATVVFLSGDAGEKDEVC